MCKCVCSVWILVSVMLLFPRPAGAEHRRTTQQTPIEVTLRPGTTKPISIPAFGWIGAPQCDSDGNIIFHSGFKLQDLTFLKLEKDGAHVLYHPSPQDGPSIFLQFYVSSEGGLYVLATDDKEQLFLLKAGNDPNSFARTRIETVKGAGPYTIKSFVVLPGDILIVFGYFDKEAQVRERGRAYLIEMNASGQVVRRSSESMGESDLKVAVDRAGAAPVVLNDGLIYFLGGSKILAVSPAGELVHKLDLPKPDSDYDAWQLNGSGGVLLVNFMKVPKDGSFMLPLYLLLDSSTGDLLRTYRPSSDLGNVLACFSEEGFTFYRVYKQGDAELVTAPR